MLSLVFCIVNVTVLCFYANEQCQFDSHPSVSLSHTDTNRASCINGLILLVSMTDRNHIFFDKPIYYSALKKAPTQPCSCVFKGHAFLHDPLTEVLNFENQYFWPSSLHLSISVNQRMPSLTAPQWNSSILSQVSTLDKNSRHVSSTWQHLQPQHLV